MNEKVIIIIVIGIIGLMFFTGWVVSRFTGTGLQDSIRDLEEDNARLRAERDAAVAIYDDIDRLFNKIGELSTSFNEQYQQLGGDISAIKGDIGDIKQISDEYSAAIAGYEESARKHWENIRRGVEFIEEFEAGLSADHD